MIQRRIGKDNVYKNHTYTSEANVPEIIKKTKKSYSYAGVVKVSDMVDFFDGYAKEINEELNILKSQQKIDTDTEQMINVFEHQKLVLDLAKQHMMNNKRQVRM